MLGRVVYSFICGVGQNMAKGEEVTVHVLHDVT